MNSGEHVMINRRDVLVASATALAGSTFTSTKSALAQGVTVPAFCRRLVSIRYTASCNDGFGWRGTDATQSIEAPRVHHAARRRGDLAARGAGAAGRARIRRIA